MEAGNSYLCQVPNVESVEQQVFKDDQGFTCPCECQPWSHQARGLSPSECRCPSPLREKRGGSEDDEKWVLLGRLKLIVSSTYQWNESRDNYHPSFSQLHESSCSSIGSEQSPPCCSWIRYRRRVPCRGSMIECVSKQKEFNILQNILFQCSQTLPRLAGYSLNFGYINYSWERLREWRIPDIGTCKKKFSNGTIAE